MMDAKDVLLIAIGAMLGAGLPVIALVWRRMGRENPGLPLWKFLRREGILPEDAADAVNAQALQNAELACTACGSRRECRGLLSTEETVAPPANCPNRRLFREFGLWQDRSRE